MAPEIEDRIHTTDTYVKIPKTLKRKNEAGTLTAEDLTGLVAGDIKFKMFNAATGVESVALTATGVAFTASTAGAAEYDFSAAGVLTAGIFNAFLVVTKSIQTIHFPSRTKGWIIGIDSDTDTAEEAYKAAGGV